MYDGIANYFSCFFLNLQSSAFKVEFRNLEECLLLHKQVVFKQNGQN